ncbi:MAG TPA: hypothetical protein VFC68_07295, partial [Treponemataceae bacterium]|nr:hypothetical protein [Treponemataceae bacterium]
KTGSILIDSWYKRERQLRFALAQIRALKMKKKHTLPVGGIPSDVIQTARTATGFNNPLEAELFLANSRFKTLESLQSLDAFSTDALFAYVLKLKIAKRIRRFNNESGLASYQNIYKTILSQSTGENR